MTERYGTESVLAGSVADVLRVLLAGECCDLGAVSAIVELGRTAREATALIGMVARDRQRVR